MGVAVAEARRRRGRERERAWLSRGRDAGGGSDGARRDGGRGGLAVGELEQTHGIVARSILDGVVR